MSSDNITTTNRQAMLNLIQQADETGEILILQDKTQHIVGDEDRTTILKNSTDGQTYDTTGTVDIQSVITINSSDSITFIGAELSVNTGDIALSTSNDDTSENASIAISYQSIGFQSANVGNVMNMEITPTGISISGTIDDSSLTIIGIRALPTSASGLNAGTIYKDGSGFLKIA
jgi:hypothetical protein